MEFAEKCENYDKEERIREDYGSWMIKMILLKITLAQKKIRKKKIKKMSNVYIRFAIIFRTHINLLHGEFEWALRSFFWGAAREN